MNLESNEITFVIVSFKSEKIIFNCINSLPKNSKIIVIENSYNANLKNDLENKYDNIEVILNNNTGMGSSNNIGIKKSLTKYVFILNPDVVFQHNTYSNLLEGIKKIDDFSILSPINDNPKYPNYHIQNKYISQNENILEVDSVDGFSMLLNKSKFDNQNFFDENFFLYLENTDLCLRQKNKNEKIYIICNSKIKHIGSYTTKFDSSYKLEYLRNWHWMWSKFYFNKKHYGFFNAFAKIFNNLISSLAKYFFYILIFNKHKKIIYKMRLLGILTAIAGKKSYLRPEN